jgi:hypothetical protein
MASGFRNRPSDASVSALPVRPATARYSESYAIINEDLAALTTSIIALRNMVGRRGHGCR